MICSKISKLHFDNQLLAPEAPGETLTFSQARRERQNAWHSSMAFQDAERTPGTPRRNATPGTPRRNATLERQAFRHGIPERQAFQAGL